MASTSQENNIISNYYSRESKSKRLQSHGRATQSVKTSGKHGASKSKTGRKSLTILQRTADSDGLTRPAARHKQAFSVYEEDEPCSCVDVGVQVAPADGQCLCQCHNTDPQEETSEEEANRLMVQEEVSEDYWQQVAEQRRQALDDTLDENQQLHEELDVLREENRALSELASQADYFASILKELTQEDSHPVSGGLPESEDQPATKAPPDSSSPPHPSSDDCH